MNASPTPQPPPKPRRTRSKQVLEIKNIIIRTRPGETETQALARGVARLVRMVEEGEKK